MKPLGIHIFVIKPSPQVYMPSPWASRGGNGHLPPLEIGTKNQNFFENL